MGDILRARFVALVMRTLHRPGDWPAYRWCPFEQDTGMRRYLLLLAFLLYVPSLQAQSTHCYLAADRTDGNSNGSSPDRLTMFNWGTTAETNLGVITGNSAMSIEALAFNPVTQKLYATDAGQFGVLSVSTTVFTKIGSGVGSSSNGTAGWSRSMTSTG